MRISELVRYLTENGVKFVKHGANHDLYRGINGNTFPISRDKNKDYGRKMVEMIMKQAGLK